MEKEKLISQAKKLHLSTKEDVLDQLIKEGNILQSQIELLKSINVDNVKPMTRISKPVSFLREDVVNFSYTKENVLKNAPKSEGDFIILKKVVKND